MNFSRHDIEDFEIGVWTVVRILLGLAAIVLLLLFSTYGAAQISKSWHRYVLANAADGYVCTKPVDTVGIRMCTPITRGSVY